jgi:nicotinamidase-related amidase
MKYCIIPFVLFAIISTAVAQQTLRITKQQRITDGDNRRIVQTVEQWNPEETAIVICDMWDKHWCPQHTQRVAELAPAMDRVLTAARNTGVKIVHAPSDCMNYYKDFAGRKEIQKYTKVNVSAAKLSTETGKTWPVQEDNSDLVNGGCECDDCNYPGNVWKKEIDALTITDDDLISDNGQETGGYFIAKGIKNVIVMGVHTNMCIVNRTFALRAMQRLGMNTVLMRDMTDLSYDDRSWPYVNRFAGLDLMIEYIESYIAPSIVSTDLTGEKQFHFREDNRKRITFLVADSTENAKTNLADFARFLTLKKNIHCDFALAPDNDGLTIENLQAIADANLLTIFSDGRPLTETQLNTLKDYVASNRPILGLFNACPFTADEGQTLPEDATEWKDFDCTVLNVAVGENPETTKSCLSAYIARGADNDWKTDGFSETVFDLAEWLLYQQISSND